MLLQVKKQWRKLSILFLLTCIFSAFENHDRMQVVQGKFLDSITIQTDGKKRVVDIKGNIKVSVKSIKNSTSKGVIWKSSNKKIATVNKNGVVTGKKQGTVIITATSITDSRMRGSVSLKVKNIKPDSLVLNTKKATLFENGKKLQLKAEIRPKGVYNRGITFQSDNLGVAGVSKKGIVMPKRVGTAIITAVTKERNKIATCMITVKKSENGKKTEKNKLEIQTQDKKFIVTLYDNDAAKEFAKRLPMTLDMDELNGNEKYFYLPKSLPVKSSIPSEIHTGDLMLYGSDCLVLFYEGLTTSFHYTPLGYMEDTAGLAKALGSGSVQITFRVR